MQLVLTDNWLYNVVAVVATIVYINFYINTLSITVIEIVATIASRTRSAVSIYTTVFISIKADNFSMHNR